jgi:transcription-repair coupling factor (superfamily II helicase)
MDFGGDVGFGKTLLFAAFKAVDNGAGRYSSSTTF